MKQKNCEQKAYMLQCLAENYGYSEETAKRMVSGNVVRTSKDGRFAAWVKPLPEFIAKIAAPVGRKDSHEIHCLEAEILFPETTKYLSYIQLRDEGSLVLDAYKAVEAGKAPSKQNNSYLHDMLFCCIAGSLAACALLEDQTSNNSIQSLQNGSSAAMIKHNQSER